MKWKGENEALITIFLLTPTAFSHCRQITHLWYIYIIENAGRKKTFLILFRYRSGKRVGKNAFAKNTKNRYASD